MHPTVDSAYDVPVTVVPIDGAPAIVVPAHVVSPPLMPASIVPTHVVRAYARPPTVVPGAILIYTGVFGTGAPATCEWTARPRSQRLCYSQAPQRRQWRPCMFRENVGVGGWGWVIGCALCLLCWR